MKTVEDLSESAILEQTIEEAGELIQACAKRLRIIRKENPTPVTINENRESMREELADVELCVEVLKAKTAISTDMTKEAKMKRWNDRLRWSENG